MADDSIMTQRLRQLAEAADEELETGETLELEELELMETAELRQLLDPAAAESTDTAAREGQDEESE